MPYHRYNQPFWKEDWFKMFLVAVIGILLITVVIKCNIDYTDRHRSMGHHICGMPTCFTCLDCAPHMHVVGY